MSARSMIITKGMMIKFMSWPLLVKIKLEIPSRVAPTMLPTFARLLSRLKYLDRSEALYRSTISWSWVV